MDEKRCIICNRVYNYNYKMFGRGCLDNLYELLEIKKPFKIINKEYYLCTKIAWKNHKYFLNKNKKYELTKKYIALSYLDKMNYDSLDNIKEQIKKDIKSISVFSSIIKNTIVFKLNDIYKLYNNSKKFDNLINQAQSVNWEEIDKKTAENFIKSMSFIFDISKKASPISYVTLYSMQYIFWQVVVIGGILTKNSLSARLLSNSLVLFGKEAQNMEINDGKTVEDIKGDEIFQKTTNELIEKYGKETKKFSSKDYEKDGTLLRFKKGDLLYALHDATMYVNAQQNENDTWNLEVEIIDTYDFTDFKELKEYADEENSELTDIFSTILNNFGVISSEYGVIKKFEIKIKFNLSDYVAE